MAPKSIKSAAEKRATRGPNSAWSKDGLKKAARTDRWYKWTYPTPSSPIQEFIATQNIPREEALSVLSAHYEKYVPCLHSEGNVDTSKQGASGSCFGYGQSSSSSDQPMRHFRDAIPPQPAGSPADMDHAPAMGASPPHTIKPVGVPLPPSRLPVDTDPSPLSVISPCNGNPNVRRVSMSPPGLGESLPWSPQTVFQRLLSVCHSSSASPAP